MKDMNKAKLVYNKWKERANMHGLRAVYFDPRLQEFDDEEKMRDLQRDAMKSLHLLPEVVRTEEGYFVT